MGAPVLFWHPSSLLHDTGAHPERADRVTAVLEGLVAQPPPQLEVRESPAASMAAIEAVHTQRMIDAVKRLCDAGGGALDADTVVSAGSWEAALHAAGGAIAAVETALTGAVGMSVHRPPGHHAERDRAMGFCLFSNAAIAAHHAVSVHGADRVAIFDFDVHHGNGTQDVFWERADVHFCSIHQWPLYPGTGAASDAGTGAGLGQTLNIPVPAGSGDREFGAAADRWADEMARARPDLIIVSAGFDAHADDPLASCRVTDDGYSALGAAVRRVASELGVGVAVVLEGGYDLGALKRSFAGFAGELTGAGV